MMLEKPPSFSEITQAQIYLCSALHRSSSAVLGTTDGRFTEVDSQIAGFYFKSFTYYHIHHYMVVL